MRPLDRLGSIKLKLGIVIVAAVATTMIVNEVGLALNIKAPKDLSWGGEYGYKARNLDIARSSDLVVVVAADAYPEGYTGMRLKVCYHCARRVEVVHSLLMLAPGPRATRAARSAAAGRRG